MRCSLNLSANALPDSAIYPPSQLTLPHLYPNDSTFLEDGVIVLWDHAEVSDSHASLEMHLDAMIAADVLAALS